MTQEQFLQLEVGDVIEYYDRIGHTLELIVERRVYEGGNIWYDSQVLRSFWGEMREGEKSSLNLLHRQQIKKVNHDKPRV